MERTLDPARMFAESLNLDPELENNQGHFHQIDTLPVLSVCPVHSDRFRNSAPQRNGARCTSRSLDPKAECQIGENYAHSPTGSPSRTKISIPCFVYSSRSSEGRHAPGSPKTTMADPPKRKTDFSSPR